MAWAVVLTTAVVVWGWATTVVVRGEPLAAEPIPTPRQTQIHIGTVKMRMQMMIPTIMEMITAAKMPEARESDESRNNN